MRRSAALDPLKTAAMDLAADAREKPAAPPSSMLDLLRSADPDVLAVTLVYFVQGALGISRLAVSFFLKDELSLQPAELALLTGAASAPWLVKPLWGFLSDSVPIFGSRRRSYLILAGSLGCLGWLALSSVVDSPSTALAALLCTALSTAVSDVVVDSLVVERSRNAPVETAGQLQSLCWGASAVGGITTALLSGSLVQSWGPRPVFLLTAAFPLLTAAVAPLLRDAQPPAPDGGAPPSAGAQLRAQASLLWSAARQRSVWAPAAFLFLWQASPSPDAALFFFTTERLGFQPDFLGRARLAGSLANLVGIGLYNFGGLKSVPIPRLFRATALLGAGLGLTQLSLVSGAHRAWGISDKVFALADSVVLTALGQVSFMPTLVLAARLCPEGVEATLFAALMSVFNLAGVTSGAGGAALTSALGIRDGNFDNLPLLIVLCNGLSLCSLPFLGLLDQPGLARPDADGAETATALAGREEKAHDEEAKAD